MLLTLESGDGVVCVASWSRTCVVGGFRNILLICQHGWVHSISVFCMHLCFFFKKTTTAFGWVASSNGPREILMENLQGLASGALIILPS
jgi:hypothetical protein